MPTIAVVGTEGSGKTVLLATLARRYADSSGPFFLDPQNRETARFVELVWETLEKREWPVSTPPGDLIPLHWRLRIAGRPDCDLRAIDCAGQDLRQLFGQEAVLDPESLPEKIKPVVKTLREAEILLFTVNLGDFIGESDRQRRLDSEWAVKFAMQHLNRTEPRPRLCLLLTQADLYASYLAEGWQDAVNRHLPLVYGSSLSGGAVTGMEISAVSDTEIVDDPRLGPRRVPGSAFRSHGLKELAVWMVSQVDEIREHADRKRIAEDAERFRQAQAARNEHERKEKERHDAAVLSAGIAAALSGLAICLLLAFTILRFVFPVMGDEEVVIDEPVYEQVPVWGKVRRGTWPFTREEVGIVGYERRQTGTKKVPHGTRRVRTGTNSFGWMLALAAGVFGGSTIYQRVFAVMREQEPEPATTAHFTPTGT